MIKSDNRYVASIYGTTRKLKKMYDKVSKSKYSAKIIKLNLSCAEINENAVNFVFDGLKGSIAQFVLDINQNVDSSMKFSLNNVTIEEKNIANGRIYFTGIIDSRNYIKILFSDISNLNDLSIDIIGEVAYQNNLFEYKVVSYSDGILLCKTANQKRIYHANTLANVNEKIAQKNCIEYAKNYLLDYAYLQGVDGEKNQEIMLVNDGNIVLRNLSTNTTQVIADKADMGSVIECNNSFCKIALVVNGKLCFFDIGNDLTVTKLSNFLQINEKILSISGIQLFSSYREGLLITTDRKTAYIVFFNSDNLPFVYDIIHHANDAQGTIIADKMYLFVKNYDKAISVYVYQFLEQEFYRKKVIFQKQYFNCDSMFVFDEKIHFISNGLCTEEGLEEDMS